VLDLVGIFGFAIIGAMAELNRVMAALMSASGQKATLVVAELFPLHPRKRTLIATVLHALVPRFALRRISNSASANQCQAEGTVPVSISACRSASLSSVRFFERRL
jgi:hypothetical protein